MDQRNGTWKRALCTHAMRELRLSILGKRDWAGGRDENRTVHFFVSKPHAFHA